MTANPTIKELHPRGYWWAGRYFPTWHDCLDCGARAEWLVSDDGEPVKAVCGTCFAESRWDNTQRLED